MSLADVIQRSKTDREAWKYTKLDDLAKISFVDASRSPRETYDFEPSNDHQQEIFKLVFLNGVWQPELSRLTGLPADLLRGNAEEGYLLSLAEQTCLALSPLELVFVSSCTAPAEATTNLRIALGKSARLTLIERHEGNDSDHPFAHVMNTSVDLSDQAKLVHGKMVQSTRNIHLAQTNVAVASGAYYDGFVLVCDGQLTRHEVNVSLNGKLSQCRLHGAELLKGSHHADITTHIRHNAPHCTSRQLVKAVLGGKSHGVFQGKITVSEGAQKADGYQLSRALLLSDQAEMDAKPELEIYADDVKCSHGSTVGDLDDTMLFYLRSRGIDEQTARALLIEAFIGELVDEIPSSELRATLQSAISTWLGQ